MSWAEQIKQYFSKTLNGSNALYIGKPSEGLKRAGLSDNPFAMYQSDLKKSNEETAKNKNYSRHGVSQLFFEKMPAHINNAVMFIENKNGVTIVTDQKMNDRKGKPSFIIVGVHPDFQMYRDTVSLVRSVYPLDDFQKIINTESNKGNVVIIDKKKVQEMLASIDVQPVELSNILALSKESITQTSMFVKKKQLDIINQSNPAPDSYHTWIRSVDDIKTHAEALDEGDIGFTPDYSESDAQRALDSGSVGASQPEAERLPPVTRAPKGGSKTPTPPTPTDRRCLFVLDERSLRGNLFFFAATHPFRQCAVRTAFSPAGSVGASACGRGLHRRPAPFPKGDGSCGGCLRQHLNRRVTVRYALCTHFSPPSSLSRSMPNSFAIFGSRV